MNVGIVGGGSISDTHARAARAAGLHVAVVFGDNREKANALAVRHHAVAVESLDELLKHPVDFVVIGSPSGCHAAQALATVRAGRHVLVEKPLDIATERIDPLLAEVERAGVTLGVIFQDRLHPEVVAMKRAIDSGDIGTPVLASAEVKWSRAPDYYASSRWRGTWALDGGGALMNQGIHSIDLLLHLLGPVAEVSGRIATRVHEIETEDTAVASMVFANGTLATVQATTAAATGQPRRVEIIGSKATVTFSEVATSAAVANHAPHQRIFEDFVLAIREGRRPICDGVEGRRSVEVVEAIYASRRRRV